jgi:hypothetical protein
MSLSSAFTILQSKQGLVVQKITSKPTRNILWTLWSQLEVNRESLLSFLLTADRHFSFVFEQWLKLKTLSPLEQ